MTKLVVIDTLAKIRPPRRQNGDPYAEDYAFGAALKRLAEQHAVCLLGLHHLRKLGAEDVFDTLSGTLGLTGAADTIWVLQRERGQAEAMLHITGRDVEERVLALCIDGPTGTWACRGSAAEVRLSEERRAIAQVIREAGQRLSPKAVAEELGKNRQTVKGLMRKMALNGDLTCEEGGLYSVPTESVNRVNPAVSPGTGSPSPGTTVGLTARFTAPDGVNPASGAEMTTTQDDRMRPGGFSTGAATNPAVNRKRGPERAFPGTKSGREGDPVDAVYGVYTEDTDGAVAEDEDGPFLSTAAHAAPYEEGEV